MVLPSNQRTPSQITETEKLDWTYGICMILTDTDEGYVTLMTIRLGQFCMIPTDVDEDHLINCFACLRTLTFSTIVRLDV